MHIIKRMTDLTKEYHRMVVVLGMFDGVHIGHQSIIKHAVALAKEIGGVSVVFTFSNHPLSVLAPERMPLQIAGNEWKERAIASLDVDVLCSIPFTREFANQTADNFLELLKQNFAPRYVVTGPNNTFGKGGKGTQRMLLREAKHYGFQAEICPAITVNGQIVSSTRIRRLIAEGKLDEIHELFAHPYTIVERVIHGDKRGRILGFPTANLAIQNTRATLPNGVYAVQVQIDNEKKPYVGLANIGINPTFVGCNRRIEVYIENFAANIYDKLIQVSFLQKIREEEKFDTVEDLVREMNKDHNKATIIWNKYGLSR